MEALFFPNGFNGDDVIYSMGTCKYFKAQKNQALLRSTGVSITPLKHPKANKRVGMKSGGVHLMLLIFLNGIDLENNTTILGLKEHTTN
jgi:hypothetical protein